MRFTWGRLAPIACVGLALVLSACGSSNSTSSTTAATSSAQSTQTSTASSAGLQAAQAAVTQAEAAPTPISLPTLSKRPPTGKTIAFVSCPVFACTATEASAKQAAAALGWKLTVTQGGLTPESQVAGLTQAVQSKPDGIIAVTVVPESVLRQPLAEAASAHIPIAAIADPQPNGAIIQSLSNTRDSEATAQLLANWIIADAAGKPANIVVYKTTEQPSSEAAATAAEQKLESSCSNCKVASEPFNLGEIGTKLPGNVVSYLQRNPSTEYVLFPTGEVDVGVATAIKAAGLPGVKMVTRIPTPEDLGNILKGTEAAAVTEELESNAWRAVDVLARTFVGDPTKECCSEPLTKFQLLNKSNITNPNVAWTVPDVKESFTRIWRLNG